MDPNSICNTNEAKSVKDSNFASSFTDFASFVLYMVWFFNNDDQNQGQERVQAATEQNHQKETLNTDQKIKKKRLKKTRNNNLLIIKNKLILCKKEAKDFWNYLRNKKKIKDVKMKKEIDFEHLESEILEIEKNVVTKKELKFALAQPTN